MDRPKEAQVQAAVAIMKDHFRKYGLTASDTMTRNAVFSMHAVMGGPGEPSLEYAAVIAEATGGDVPPPKPALRGNPDGSFTVVKPNPLGLPLGRTFYPEEALYEKEAKPDPSATVVNTDILNKMTKQQIIDKYGGTFPALSMDMSKPDMVALVLDSKPDDPPTDD